MPNPLKIVPLDRHTGIQNPESNPPTPAAAIPAGAISPSRPAPAMHAGDAPPSNDNAADQAASAPPSNDNAADQAASAPSSDPDAPRALDWARRFLPHYFTDEPADFHRDLLADLENPARRLIARVAPRGHAKSTCAALAYPLWCICERQKKNIVIITHESSLATQFVRDIRHELDSNELILAHYGDLCRDASASEPTTPVVGCSEPQPQACGQTSEPRPEGRGRAATGRAAAESTAPPPPPNPKSKIQIPKSHPKRTTPVKWTETMLTTATGITVQAKSAGASFRGTRVGPQRPDLIICDDIEKDDLVESPDARKKLEHWLRRVVMPALAPDGQLLIVGSIIHHDSLLASLADRARFKHWDYRVYRALEAEYLAPSAPVAPALRGRASPDPVAPALRGRASPDPVAPALRGRAVASGALAGRGPDAAVASGPRAGRGSPETLPVSAGGERLIALWPARWPVEKLQLERERIGFIAFEQEYQANPIDTTLRTFRPEWLGRYEPAELEHKRLAHLMAVDPATGKEAGDFFALWVGAVDQDTGVIYTRVLQLARVGIVEQVRRILDAVNLWKPVRVGIETTAYQVALKDFLDDYGRRHQLHIPIVAINASANKRARIEGSAPFYENGTMRLPQSLDEEAELQFLQFPKSKHDDAPDVCAMGIELARHSRGLLKLEAATAKRSLFPRNGGW